jgi:hypothetical protein
MSPPKHLWSGDWRQDSATVAEELATRRTQATHPDRSDQTTPQARTRRSLSDRIAARTDSVRTRLLWFRNAPVEDADPTTVGAAHVSAHPRTEPASARTVRTSAAPKRTATPPAHGRRTRTRDLFGRASLRPVAIVALAALLIAGSAYALTSALRGSPNRGAGSSPNTGVGISASAGPGGSAGTGAGGSGSAGTGAPGAAAGGGAGSPGAGSGSQGGQSGGGSGQQGQSGGGSGSQGQPGAPSNPALANAGSAAWLGVDIDTLPFGGVVVVFVEPGSPAAAAGAEPGDVITRIDNHPIYSTADLHAALASLHPGDRVQISISRGSTLLTAQATLAARPGRVP